MNKFTNQILNNLTTILDEIQAIPWLFTKNPKSDFSRNRKLPIKTVMKILLSMGGSSLTKELLNYFSFDINTASSSAFVQQRQKLLPIAMQYLLYEFNKTYCDIKTYKNHRLLAIDGSSINIPYNTNDKLTYFEKSERKGYNLLHLNGIYDLCNNIYLDAIVQNGKQLNEYSAYTQLVDRSNLKGNTIIIADRGYESYNLFAHAQEKGWNYLTRVKDVNSRGMLCSFDLPDKPTFDVDIDLLLSKKQNKALRAKPNYKFLNIAVNFDYADLSDNLFYEMSLRIVRFEIAAGSYECIITNLDRSKFTVSEIKNLYNMRWGIETSFRQLKYSVGLNNFHSKKTKCIIQEIFARIIMYNFTEMLVSKVIISIKNINCKYAYKVNFTIAVFVCRQLFPPVNLSRPPNVEEIIAQHTCPVRPGRKFPRKVKTKSSISFLYRIS